MRLDDQKNSLLDYVQFILAAPVRPGLEKETAALRTAQTRLRQARVDPGEESLLAMRLVELLYRLRDKKLQLGQ